jgi:hypothetical protein
MSELREKGKQEATVCSLSVSELGFCAVLFKTGLLDLCGKRENQMRLLHIPTPRDGRG